jgi:hypothetical protein
MLAHALVLGALDFAIFLIEEIVQWRLLNHVPRIWDIECWRGRLDTNRHGLFLRNWGSIQSAFGGDGYVAIGGAVLFGGSFSIPDKELITVSDRLYRSVLDA